jgi:hypothetical protein
MRLMGHDTLWCARKSLKGFEQEEEIRRMNRTGLGIVVMALCFAAPALANDTVELGPAQDGTNAALTKIAGEATMNSHAFEYLEELSDDIGARVTGSPAEHKAEQWGEAKMKAIGLENVHLEKYTIWKGWTRGTADVEMLTPVARRLHADSMGWTGSTPPGGAEGDVVTVNMFDLDNEIKQVSRLKGKVALIVHQGQRKKDFGSLFADFGTFLRAATKAGAIAVIGGQGGSKSAGMNLTHTGILGFNADFSIPVLSMTEEDQGQLERLIAHGITPRLRLNVQNTFTDGPVETANVVGEIRGSEDPQQILVVGAHLDSWDLSEGTTDNGSGVATVLGAAEAIARSGERPRRTIRFVLFTGEEEGLDGSFAYVKQHQAEMPDHLGDLVLDGLHARRQRRSGARFSAIRGCARGHPSCQR